MRALLPGFGTAALGLAVLLTLFLAVATRLFTLRPPGGADAMGLVVVLALPVLAWLLLLAAALAALVRGGFDWVAGPAGIPTLAVLSTTVGLAGLSVAAALFSLEVRHGARTVVGLAGGLVLPLAAAAFVGALLWSEPAALAATRWLRPVGVALALLAALAYLGGAGLLVKESSESARRAAAAKTGEDEWFRRNQAETAALRERQAAELAALPDDAPIEAFLAHLFVDKSEEHHRKAVERIRSLPGLTARLAARLEHAEPLEREHVLNFVAMSGTPDPAWEPLVRAAIVRLAADYRAEARDLSLGRITHVKGLAHGALLAARAFGPGRFEAEVRDLRAAVAEWPNEGPREDALAVLDLYLAGKPLPE